jgi:hypothetical protein
MGDINTETWSFRLWGLDTRLTTFLCKKKKILAKSKEVKTGWSTNLSEIFKEATAKKGCFASDDDDDDDKLVTKIHILTLEPISNFMADLLCLA